MRAWLLVLLLLFGTDITDMLASEANAEISIPHSIKLGLSASDSMEPSAGSLVNYTSLNNEVCFKDIRCGWPCVLYTAADPRRGIAWKEIPQRFVVGIEKRSDLVMFFGRNRFWLIRKSPKWPLCWRSTINVFVVKFSTIYFKIKQFACYGDISCDRIPLINDIVFGDAVLRYINIAHNIEPRAILGNKLTLHDPPLMTGIIATNFDSEQTYSSSNQQSESRKYIPKAEAFILGMCLISVVVIFVIYNIEQSDYFILVSLIGGFLPVFIGVFLILSCFLQSPPSIFGFVVAAH